MNYVHAEAATVYAGKGGSQAPVIYVIDLPPHPFDVAPVASGRSVTIVTVPVENWDDALTPWAASGLYPRDADFGGDAATTLEELLTNAIPFIERKNHLAPQKRALCGYSLGDLFALYAFVRTSAFDACACLSGSLWYEGWVNYLRDYLRGSAPALEGHFAFLSIGAKEKSARPAILHSVEDNMRKSADILREHGCEVEFVVGPGTHFDHGLERFDAGFTALDRALLSRGTAPGLTADKDH